MVGFMSPPIPPNGDVLNCACTELTFVVGDPSFMCHTPTYPDAASNTAVPFELSIAEPLPQVITMYCESLDGMIASTLTHISARYAVLSQRSIWYGSGVPVEFLNRTSRPFGAAWAKFALVKIVVSSRTSRGNPYRVPVMVAPLLRVLM